MAVATVAAPSSGQAQATATAGLTPYTFGTPSGDETEILQIINRARANPAAEGQRLVAAIDPTGYGIGLPDASPVVQQEYYDIINELLPSFDSYPARPPVAFNAALNAAAQFHLPEMIAAGYETHYSPNGDYFDVRDVLFGYKIPTGENVAGSATYPFNSLPYQVEDDYEIDTDVPRYGHRLNVMEPFGIGEVEVGIAEQAFGGWNVEDFGSNYTPTLLTGVVFTDNAGTGFYASSEGVASVVVTAPGASTFFAVTVQSGAYTLPLDSLGPVYAWGASHYDDPATGTMVYSPLNPVPTVTVVFTDALGNVTTQTVTPHHTVVQVDANRDADLEYSDAAGNVRYDNAEVDLVEPATNGGGSGSGTPTPAPTPAPTPTPMPVAVMPQVMIAPGTDSNQFVLTRTGDTSQPLTVSYAVKGSAVAGQDYVLLKGTKKFKPGKSSVQIAVQPLPGAHGVVKLVLAPGDNAYTAPTPADAKIRLYDGQ